MLVWLTTRKALLLWLAMVGVCVFLLPQFGLAADQIMSSGPTTADMTVAAPAVVPESEEAGSSSANVSAEGFLVAKLCTYGLTLLAVACGGIVYFRRHRALLPYETLAGIGLVVLIMLAGIWLIRSQILEPVPLACLDSPLTQSSDYTNQCRAARESFANLYGGKSVLRWFSPETNAGGVVAPIAVGINRLIFYSSALLCALLGFAIIRAIIRKKL